jgi:peroxiredoxin
MNRFWLVLIAGLLTGPMQMATAADEIPGPAVGDTFNEALTIKDQTGQFRSLDDLTGEKGLVIVFVRSADWCPFCQKQLMDVNQRLPEFQALGLNVVSISVDAVAEITAFAEARSIRYPMLADTEGAINKRLGIRDEQYPTGSYAFGVPRPTLYVVDRAAVVRARYMEPTYKTRPDLDVVIRDARALGL